MNLVGASFRVKEITETVVYGIAASDLRRDPNMPQSKLVVERTYGFYSDMIAAGAVPLTVDDMRARPVRLLPDEPPEDAGHAEPPERAWRPPARPVQGRRAGAAAHPARVVRRQAVHRR